ncbi:esterase-like [Rosa sericea]
MEYTSRVIISLFCCYMLLLHITSITVSPALALEDCEFPAIFNFGDSNSDTGGFAASIYPPPTPYGETYFHMPVGRISDGRLIVDFLAKSLGHPFLSAYLDSLGTNFSHGANFATSASTIRLPDLILPAGGFSPFYLDIQYVQFRELKSRSQLIRQRGGIFASLMPKEEYFSKALYTFDIGQNDLGEGFFGNKTIQEVNASVPDIITGFSTNIKKIYDLGARSFWIHNTGPIGCVPYILVKFPSAQKDEVGCAKAYNEVAQYFNHELKQAIVQLRKDLPLAAFTYVDVYSVKYSIFKEPKKYGFELPLVACCGYGGKYNYNSSKGCGATITVNGSQIFVGSCKNPSARVNWDGIHYTEAAAKFVFEKISNGAYSDPPLPLKQACHRSGNKKK